MPNNPDPGSRYRRAIGQTIAMIRAERGWSLRAFAESSGISLAYLSELEHGQKEPSGATLEQLARAFELPLADLLHLIADRLEEPQPPPDIPIEGLDRADIEKIAEFAEWLRSKKER
ncbi:MAG TPA: helix-turn-helix transcriptional regulator [Nitrolancea sp.]